MRNSVSAAMNPLNRICCAAGVSAFAPLMKAAGHREAVPVELHYGTAVVLRDQQTAVA